MAEYSIIKCHGSGNDFVLIDELEPLVLDHPDRAALSRLLCDRQGPIGADGLLFVQKGTQADLRMRMFNPDGSEAQTCGNGLRCVARFGSERLQRTSLLIETMRGVSAACQESEIAPGVKTFGVELGPFSTDPASLPLVTDTATHLDRTIDGLSLEIRFSAVSAPNPHLIAVVDSIDKELLVELGRRAASLPEVLPEGANVSFCRVVDATTLAVATYERGAGLTLSCGSAMTASTLAACILDRTRFGHTLRVFNDGGFVHARAETNDGEYSVWLSGNATFVAAVTIDVDLERGTVERIGPSADYVYEEKSYDPILDQGRRIMQQASTG